MRFIRKLLMAAIVELWYAHWPHATRHTGTLAARNNSTKSKTRISSSAFFFSFHFLCCGNFVQQDQVYFLSFSFDQLSISSVVVQILQFSKLICFHADNKRKAGAAGLWQTFRWAVPVYQENPWHKLSQICYKWRLITHIIDLSVISNKLTAFWPWLADFDACFVLPSGG